MGRTDPGQGEWGELRYKTTQNKGERDSCGYYGGSREEECGTEAKAKCHLRVHLDMEPSDMEEPKEEMRCPRLK